jgi:hypothetical protein
MFGFPRSLAFLTTVQLAASAPRPIPASIDSPARPAPQSETAGVERNPFSILALPTLSRDVFSAEEKQQEFEPFLQFPEGRMLLSDLHTDLSSVEGTFETFQDLFELTDEQMSALRTMTKSLLSEAQDLQDEYAESYRPSHSLQARKQEFTERAQQWRSAVFYCVRMLNLFEAMQEAGEDNQDLLLQSEIQNSLSLAQQAIKKIPFSEEAADEVLRLQRCEFFYDICKKCSYVEKNIAQLKSVLETSTHPIDAHYEKVQPQVKALKALLIQSRDAFHQVPFDAFEELATQVAQPYDFLDTIVTAGQLILKGQEALEDSHWQKSEDEVRRLKAAIAKTQAHIKNCDEESFADSIAQLELFCIPGIQNELRPYEQKKAELLANSY